MPRISIFEACGDGSQDEGSLYSLSGEFLEAARLLRATPPTRTNFSLVIYYLAGHAAELMLKAFLYRQAMSVSQLKILGHDLEKLVMQAREKGLSDKAMLPNIRQLASAYMNKDFEYRKRAKRTFPDLDLLIEEVNNLQSVVFDNICS